MKPSHKPYELILAVAHGNQNKAEEIIKKNPKQLLNNTAEVVDYTGKIIKGKTALQVALINFDVEMAEMIKPYLVMLENGQDELEKQYDAIFPMTIGTNAEQLRHEAFDFSKITQAIAAAPDEEVEQALAKLHRALNGFRTMFDKISYNSDIFNP